jgi:hypothetical protein
MGLARCPPARRRGSRSPTRTAARCRCRVCAAGSWYWSSWTPHCTDICPLVSQEFVDAHQLITIPGWHFLTGPAAALRAVGRACGVAVQAPSPDADIVHTSAVYFIGPGGTERYLAEPMADHTSSGAAYLPAGQIAAWGRGIALVARTLSS